MRAIVIALALVAGCGSSTATDNQASPADGPKVEGSGLTGLYEGGSAARPDQLCLIESGGKAQFGLAVWGDGMHNCAGSGTAKFEGKSLQLTMTADQPCTIDARMESGTIALPDNIPDSCAYYCGAGAKMAGTSFTRKGATVADALKAKDLVGESLCGGFQGAP